MAAVQSNILSVSQLTRRVKGLLEGEIGSVWVAGEISNWRVSPAGHAYFTLKDADSQIDAVMFRGRIAALRFKPDSGLEVIVCGLVTVYEKRGNYQIVCEEMQPKGLGALQLAFERLKKKLEAEGLFDEAHKKPLPLLPKRIGIVTSPTGAAIRDILNVINRRFANVHIVLYPARVQGDEAAPEIAEGIRALDAWGVDVMIVGRGGGSLEDLWPFNEEVVVRAIYEARTPIISAVGHEIDFTLADFVADERAPTPSAAAELVVKERQALSDRIRVQRERLLKLMRTRADRLRSRLALAGSCYVLRRPEDVFRQRRQQTDELRMRLQAAASAAVTVRKVRLDRAGRSMLMLSPAAQLHRSRERYARLQQRMQYAAGAQARQSRSRLMPALAQLQALSPLAILSRGYSLTWKLPERDLVREAGQLAPGDRVYIRLGSGGATAAVDGVEEEPDASETAPGSG